MNATVAAQMDLSKMERELRRSGKERVALRLIGMWPGNRGNTGICPFHVHEVANDIVLNDTCQDRYHHICLVKIPTEKLEAVRLFNKRITALNPLLPPFSEDMEYVCITKTHFTFAQKVIDQGTRYLFDNATGQDAVRAKLRDTDVEGRIIQKNGPLAVIYSEEMFDDYTLMSGLASRDNKDSLTCLMETEMNAFTTVDHIYNDLMGAEAFSQEDVLARVQTMTQWTSFTEQQWKGFITLR